MVVERDPNERPPSGYYKNGKVNWAVVGYVIMALAVTIAFYGVSYNDRKTDRALIAVQRNDEKVEKARIERVEQLNKVNLAQCRSLQNLYAILQKSILESDRAIDEILYYRTHPVEREQAHDRNRETLESFRKPPCPPGSFYRRRSDER